MKVREGVIGGVWDWSVIKNEAMSATDRLKSCNDLDFLFSCFFLERLIFLVFLILSISNLSYYCQKS